jgi:hypothetical protein
MNRKKKKANPGKNKKAFDSVMATYRQLGRTGFGNVRIGGEPGAQYKVKTNPSPVEFRADVSKQVLKVVKGDKLAWFWSAYSFDSPDPQDIELFVQFMLGDRRHSWEQRIGLKFVESKIFPTSLYFMGAL